MYDRVTVKPTHEQVDPCSTRMQRALVAHQSVDIEERLERRPIGQIMNFFCPNNPSSEGL